ncbi:universal stress protein [Halomicrococcus sp. NG-SE-24]|uniref:universal stress protein n=1 Tax=Halomicrococcus sp. NG-SE-24 TaxID=3436928 RepID=UPI003D98CE93
MPVVTVYTHEDTQQTGPLLQSLIWFSKDYFLLALVGEVMAYQVLVPLDGSECANQALEYTLEKFPDAVVTTIHVISPIESVYAVEAGGLPVAEELYDNAQERASEIHGDAEELADEYGVELDTVTEVGKPARTILEYADEHEINQIVMGSHGRTGVERVVLGSVAESVMRRAQIPVTVVR